MDHLDDIAATAAKGRMYDPSEIVLIGAHLEPMRPDTTSEDIKKANIRVESDLVDALTLYCHPITEVTAAGINRSTDPAIAIIYAYAYEGHTYRLPKPRIMIVSTRGEPYRPSTEDDDTASETGKLHMWRMSKHHHSVSIEIESGSLEKLVLEGNTPGNRSVTSYSAHMQLAHRGGRLT